MPDDPESIDAATPRPDRLTSLLVAPLTDRGPSAATVELYDEVLACARQMRAGGRSGAQAVAALRDITRNALELHATTFALERCAHSILGDVTRWCLSEYFRPQRNGAVGFAERAANAR